MLRYALFLCLLSGSRQLSITEFEVPDAVGAGESAELQCRYDLSGEQTEAGVLVKWWWTPLGAGSDQRKHLYQRIAGHEPQATHHLNITIKENDTLVLQELQPSDAGTYECEVSDNAIDEVRRHQDLIVYSEGTGPILNMTKLAEGEEAAEGAGDVLVECRAYEVAPLPELVITVAGERVEAQEWVSSAEDGRYEVSANVTLSADQANGNFISCDLQYNATFEHPEFKDAILYDPTGGASTLPPSEAPDTPPATEPTVSVGGAGGGACAGLLAVVIPLQLLTLL